MEKTPHTCPTCHKAASWDGNAFRPFCSERCRMLDLDGWFGERYRIAEDEDPDPNDSSAEENGARLPETGII